MNGALGHVRELRENVVVGDGSRQLEVTIRDVARGIVERDEAALYPEWELGPPEDRGDGSVRIRDEMDTAHPSAGGIACPESGGKAVGDELGDASRASCNVVC